VVEDEGHDGRGSGRHVPGGRQREDGQSETRRTNMTANISVLRVSRMESLAGRAIANSIEAATTGSM
jgi:hypothetical protein